MKRYAIVRVDKLKFCPSDIEGIDDKLVCSKTKDGESKVCVCRYGDTKEQLVAKVEQIIRKNVKNGVCVYTENNYIHTTDNRFFWHWVAQHIVEFLGVEE